MRARWSPWEAGSAGQPTGRGSPTAGALSGAVQSSVPRLRGAQPFPAAAGRCRGWGARGEFRARQERPDGRRPCPRRAGSARRRGEGQLLRAAPGHPHILMGVWGHALERWTRLSGMRLLRCLLPFPPLPKNRGRSVRGLAGPAPLPRLRRRCADKAAQAARPTAFLRGGGCTSPARESFHGQRGSQCNEQLYRRWYLYNCLDDFLIVA